MKQALAPLGRALEAYRSGASGAALTVHVASFPPEELPVAYFFREVGEMDAVDRAALSCARGRILDVGAGAGAHAVPLIRAGHAVTALDLLPEAVAILLERGVEDAHQGSVWTFSPPAAPHDTVLALMNGVGLAGTPGGLDRLLGAFVALVAPGGQLLIDSTELEEDGEEEENGGEVVEAEGAGGAELHYQLEFGGERGPPFPQLFVDAEALGAAAARTGWSAEVVAREGPRYLARLKRGSSAG